MKETKHTPGPWIVRSHEPWVIAKDHGDMKSVVHLNYPIEQTPTQQANAHLVAAAPEMLKALEVVTDSIEAEIEARYPPEIKEHPAMMRRYEQDMEEVKEARAIISKARGEKET
jgi:hypothetical protein